jgi:RNA polymerase sigma factor (sigma-70 family)
MNDRAERFRGKHRRAQDGQGVLPRANPSTGRMGDRRVGDALGEWQEREVRVARMFNACSGLDTAQLEDLYQDVVEGLLGGSYENEEHLRNTLRRGIKNRALNLRRNERTRARILALNAPALHRVAQAREDLGAPEQALLLDEDREIVAEFFAELTPREREVFPSVADGMRYRAIATALEIPVNEARNACRSGERKAERFMLLYESGRLCGYRARTITALLDGQTSSEELAGRAVAHLRHCARCRAEHHTNARQLERSFREQALALLPLPALAKAGWLRALLFDGCAVHVRLPGKLMALRVRMAAGRVAPSLSSSVGGVRLSLRLAAAAAVAAGTVSATHVLTQSGRPPAARAPAARASVARLSATRPAPAPLPGKPHLSSTAHRESPAVRRRAALGEVVVLPHPPSPPLSEVPTPPQRLPLAVVARARPEPTQSGGGPFSP